MSCLELLQLPPRLITMGDPKPALLQPQLTHTPGHGWGWHGWSPGHLHPAKYGTNCGKNMERKVVMDCNELVGSETSLLTFITCTCPVETKNETPRVRQNFLKGSLNQTKVLEKRKPCCPASRYSRNSSLLPPTILPGLSQSLQTSLLSLGGLEGGLGAAKNNQPLPRCDRNRRKHIARFRGRLMAISPNPFVVWH